MIKDSIVLVPFPFDDFSTLKVRPSLCLTNAIGKFDQVIIAFISSKVPDEILDTDIVLQKGTSKWEGSGLSVDSVIRVHKIATISKSLILRKLGTLNPEVKQEVTSRLKTIFVL